MILDYKYMKYYINNLMNYDKFLYIDYEEFTKPRKDQCDKRSMQEI